MAKKKDESMLAAIEDNSVNELFEIIESGEQPKYLSYIPGLFTTASLPFKNVNKTVFTRKGSQGLTLTLTSPINVPFGRYGRLLLTVLTTHAVLSKEKNVQVMVEYSSLSELLKEMQLPRQRGKDIKEQLDCFTYATFAFEHKETTLQAGYLFKELYDGNYPKKDVQVTTKKTGSIRFTTGVQYQEVNDNETSPRFGNFKIVISAEFANFCQKHAVPIDYGVYKNISSAVGKDIYAWLVFRNNGLTDPQFIPRDKLVEQFMPVTENAHPKQHQTNYTRILDHLKEIKIKYYPEVKISFDPNGGGITLYKSPTPILKDDTRYALITSDI